ncbi:hypothetical protein NQ317_001318 [Molorchus minor]|uniref:eIF-4F 25 kDa subunit n=1 Tax=Molorchus minor TaxID=1323400 RepID=A0ABQ9J9H3_9CUCU|nr:hypothetical protein NQ317_001318 [Molorchus minor]
MIYSFLIPFHRLVVRQSRCLQMLWKMRLKKTTKKSDNELDIPMDYSIKHPLQNCWTLWYYESDRSQSWEKNQKEIASFQTVEDFWSLYNHIKPASELRQGSDYSLFKKGIRPMWEDDANKKGGRWLLSLERKQRNNELDRYWLDILVRLSEHSDELCGAVVNIRQKGDKIGIWTANADNRGAVMEIGGKLKRKTTTTSTHNVNIPGTQRHYGQNWFCL